MTLVARVLPLSPYASLSEYVDAGGGRGLEACRGLDAPAVIAALDAAGLRGRGGAWFPTGEKWRTVLANASDAVRTTVVVNGAEGEPGTFKDRTILRANPYAVLEGAAIAARVVGADRIVVGLKASFTEERVRLDAALAEAVAAGWLDGVRVDVVEGPDAYLFGEETALLEVIDGRPPFPRIAPPYRRGVDEVVEGDDDVDTGSGLSAHVEMATPDDASLAPPALVDNVETMANVAVVLADGADAYRSVGTATSPGTIVCTVTGVVHRAAVGEVALGTTVRQAIADIGGGVVAGVDVVLVLNGVSAAPLAGDRLDTPLTLDAMAAAGSALGTSSLHVVAAGTGTVAVAAGVARFLAVESCGQCTPCKQDGLAIADALERLCGTGAGAEDVELVRDRLTTVADGARCALARQQQTVLIPLLERFAADLEARVEATEPLPVYLVSELDRIQDGRSVDVDRAGKQPDWTYDATWSGATPVERVTDHRAGSSTPG